MIKTGISVLGRFLETLTTLPVPELLFRGHANESWDLIPSAFRQGSVGIRSVISYKLGATPLHDLPIPCHVTTWNGWYWRNTMAYQHHF